MRGLSKKSAALAVVAVFRVDELIRCISKTGFCYFIWN